MIIPLTDENYGVRLELALVTSKAKDYNVNVVLDGGLGREVIPILVSDRRA